MVSKAHLQLIILAAAVSAGFGTGWMVNGWRMGVKLESLQLEHQTLVTEALERRMESERRAREVEQARQQRNSALSAAAAARSAARDAEAQVVTKEIIKYVQSPVRRCHLDPDWVRIHDIAADPGGGGVSAGPGTASDTDAGAAAVTAADTLLVVTGNYARCNEIRDQLKGLQEWAKNL